MNHFGEYEIRSAPRHAYIATEIFKKSEQLKYIQFGHGTLTRLSCLPEFPDWAVSGTFSLFQGKLLFPSQAALSKPSCFQAKLLFQTKMLFQAKMLM